MKKFTDWLQQEAHQELIDGPPLNPHTISGAEYQIRTLASNIRSTFLLDKKWENFKNSITNATKLLDNAADVIDNGKMSGDLRNMPHKFHNNNLNQNDLFTTK